MSFPILKPAKEPIQQQSSSQEKSTASIYGGVAGSVTVASPETRKLPDSMTADHTAKWSASVQALLDQPPSALSQQLILGGMAFCLAFGAWAMLGQIDEVGRAQGRLVPKGEVYKIDPIELGQVARIAVKEGQSVKAGQVLVELDTQVAVTEVERLQQMLAAQQVELIQKQSLIDKTRLEAKTREAIANADTQAAAAALQEANAKATAAREQLTELQTTVAASKNRLEKLKPLAGKTQELRKKLEVDVVAAAEEVERLKPLVQQGAIARKYMLEAEQTLRDRQSAITKSQLDEDTSVNQRQFEAEQTVRDRTSAITQHAGELQQTLAELDRLQAARTQKQAEGRKTQIEAQQQIQQLEVDITQLKAKIAENQNLLKSAKAKLKQRFLYAPVNGVVSSLSVSNIGEVVQPGKTVAELAADNTPLVLSAVLPNREAGFVKTGMSVQVKFDAYPYQDYGVISGKVKSISPDAKPDEHLGPVYRVEVTLDRNYVTANHKTIQFKAGQTASADIIIRRRRIADLLLDPIRQLQKGGISL